MSKRKNQASVKGCHRKIRIQSATISCVAQTRSPREVVEMLGIGSKGAREYPIKALVGNGHAGIILLL
jgi:hypothetical protein